MLISQTVMAQNVNHNYVAMIIHCHPSLLLPKFSFDNFLILQIKSHWNEIPIMENTTLLYFIHWFQSNFNLCLPLFFLTSYSNFVLQMPIITNNGPPLYAKFAINLCKFVLTSWWRRKENIMTFIEFPGFFSWVSMFSLIISWLAN